MRFKLAKKKKHTAKKKEEKSLVYVKIDNALTLRKQILEAAIEVVTLLKRLENYKIIREMKLKQIKELRTLMGKIEREFSGFKKEVPRIEIEKAEEKLEEEEKEMPAYKDKGLSEIDRELEEIKEKLAHLRI